MASTFLQKRDIVRIVSWTIAANFLAIAIVVVTVALSVRSEFVVAAVNSLAGWGDRGEQSASKSNLSVSFAFKDAGKTDIADVQKSGLNYTLVEKLQDNPDELAEEVNSELALGEEALAPEAYEEVRAMAIEPILKAQTGTGKPMIGSFKAISVSGSSDSCVDLGHSMLVEAKSSKELLDVMVETDAITIAKICTKNGAIFLTCRMNQITISPRRPRPDNGC